MAILGGRERTERGRVTPMDVEAGMEPRGRPRGGLRLERDERLANALGWFSVGLGVAQLAAPRQVARMIGVGEDRDTRTVMRAVGLREIATGVGILTRPKPAGWVWARVAGDVVDLALLGRALGSRKADRPRVAAAMAAVTGVGVLDVLDGQELRRERRAMEGVPPERAVRVAKAITVNRPLEEVFAFWHDFENLPRFMSQLESVRVTGERRSRWRARGPAGRVVEWDVEIFDDRLNELIAWHSVAGAEVDTAGVVQFQPAPGGRGTEVRMELSYEPRGGAIGATLAKLFGADPGQMVGHYLRAFKQVIETGEVLRSEGSLWGPFLPQRPAQPPEELARA